MGNLAQEEVLPAVYSFLLEASYIKTAKKLKSELRQKEQNIAISKLKNPSFSLLELCKLKLKNLKKRKRGEGEVSPPKGKKQEKVKTDSIKAKVKKRNKKADKSQKPVPTVGKVKKIKLSPNSGGNEGEQSSNTKSSKKKKNKKVEKVVKDSNGIVSDKNNGKLAKKEAGADDEAEDADSNRKTGKKKDQASKYNDLASKNAEGDRQPKLKSTPFRRVNVEEELSQVKNERLKDNTYEGTFGNEGWGAKANNILGKVRGRDFRHEKTKKKRGGYRGGIIDQNAVRSIKFED